MRQHIMAVKISDNGKSDDYFESWEKGRNCVWEMEISFKCNRDNNTIY